MLFLICSKASFNIQQIELQNINNKKHVILKLLIIVSTFPSNFGFKRMLWFDDLKDHMVIDNTFKVYATNVLFF